MSTNLVNKNTGELTTLASGVRCWIGTKSAHDMAESLGKLPNNCMICITDDYESKPHTEVIAKGVTLNTEYDIPDNCIAVFACIATNSTHSTIHTMRNLPIISANFYMGNEAGTNSSNIVINASTRKVQVISITGYTADKIGLYAMCVN